MFEKILYPTDFSDTAGKTLKYIKQLKDAGAKEVVLLNVIHQRTLDTIETLHSVVYFQDGRYQEDAEEAVKKMKEDRRKRLAPIADEMEQYGFKVKMRIEKGIPRREILKIEKEEDVSVIVMGSHGRSDVSGMLIGSVSEKVVRRSTKPVLIVKR